MESEYPPCLCVLPIQVLYMNSLQIQAKLKPHIQPYTSLAPLFPTSNPRREAYADVRYCFSELKTNLEVF